MGDTKRDSIFSNLIINDPKVAFEKAIQRGVLSRDASKPNYAGEYMYMYSDKGVDFFKHHTTRQYIESAEPSRIRKIFTRFFI